ncbi:MFS transporter [Kitasatospora sp. NPDC101183]|uniref:MFS transporter n=1 Tax=Kitasatospora sp. NPDC101183 TaxID=3364100 RepID=UPI003806E96C
MKTRGTYRTQLRHKGFRRYFVGESVSSVGDSMTDITVVMLAISLLTPGNQPIGIALATGAYLVPSMVSGLILARWIGRLGGRTMLLVDSVWRGCLLGVVAVLAMTSSLDFGLCVGLLALASVSRPLYSAGARAIVVELVPTDGLFAANSLVGVALQAASLIGPVAAGSAIAVLGPASAMGLDALSFLFFAGALLLVPRPTVRAPFAGQEAGHPTVRSWGIVRLVRIRSVGTLFGLTAVFYLLYGPFVVCLPLMMAERVHDWSPALTLGLLWAAFGVGALVGGGFAGRFSELAHVRIAALSAAGWGVAMLVVALPLNLGIALAAMFAGGLSYAPYGAIATTVLQRELPPEQLNAASSYYGSMTNVAAPAGTFVGGAAAGLFSPATSVLAAGAVLAAVGTVVFLLGRPHGGRPTRYSVAEGVE